MASNQSISRKIDPLGLIIAWSIIILWAISLVFWMSFELSWKSPWTYLGVLIQTHLYTGLFITAHDAMHGIVSSDKRWNHFTG
jgi:beta-carotene ketolase (CrtW type)